MLSSLEMVSEPSGKTKTLADLIKEGSIITPETPVYTSDDSIELKDYIESLLPAPVSSDWTLAGSVENMAFNTSKAFGSAIDAALSGDYVDMCIVVHAHDATYTYCDVVYNMPVEFFKTLSADNPLYLSTAIASTGQNALVFQIFVTKSSDAYSALYKGANHFYNSGTQIDIKFYFK